MLKEYELEDWSEWCGDGRTLREYKEYVVGKLEERYLHAWKDAAQLERWLC